MRLLVLRGNPRLRGVTQHLTGLFVQGAREAGAHLDDVHLPSLSVASCTGCYHCWLTTPGECVIHDDMAPLLELLRTADVVVCATPLYNCSMTSSLKAFLERTIPLYLPYASSQGEGALRHGLRRPEAPPQSLITLAVGGFMGDENFAGLRATFRGIARRMAMSWGGELIRPESNWIHFASRSKPKTARSIEAAFAEAGREAATVGKLSEAVEAAAARPLAPDAEHFDLYSNVYWEHASADGVQHGDLAGLAERVGLDVRILMREMVRGIDPVATARLRATFQFDFADRGLHYRVVVERGSCELEEGQTERPDLRVACDAETWARVFARDADVRDLLRSGQIRLEGDKCLFSRLRRYFPPPAE